MKKFLKDFYETTKRDWKIIGIGTILLMIISHLHPMSLITTFIVSFILMFVLNYIKDNFK